MTPFTDPVPLPRMLLHCRGPEPLSCTAGEITAGVQECEDCLFEFDIPPARVFVDDVELVVRLDGRYQWRPDFLAGRVDIVAVGPAGDELRFHIEVAPAGTKIDIPSYQHMLAEVRRFRAALLLGDSAARCGFDSNQQTVLDDALRLARLTVHGLRFAEALRGIARAARPAITQRQDLVSLSRARRVAAAALRDPRIASFALGLSDAQRTRDLAVSAHLVESTLNTPPHRALKALAMRIRSAVTELLERIHENRLRGDREAHALRKERRVQMLRGLLSQLDGVLRKQPFSSVTRTETTAAALTQLAAFPPYAAAYRMGTSALDRGIDGASEADQLAVQPTWGVYETWCFVALMNALSTSLDKAWVPCLIRTATDESWQLQLDDGLSLELHFQAKFAASAAPPPGHGMWSISRERIPDIVLVLRGLDVPRFAVLDAKYRRQRPNVLEAMESAHLYRDSLRLGHARADFCFLLLPTTSDVGHLDTDGCHTEHQVGTICEFAPGRDGLARCVRIIEQWIGLALEDHTHEPQLYPVD